MSKLVGRHGLSAANDRNNRGTPLFGHPDAPLMDEGMIQAQAMGEKFTIDHGVETSQVLVAVSFMRRSQETARGAGFVNLKPYKTLNEVDTKLDHAVLKQYIAEKRHTPVALRAAELILADPPAESIWVTHGLVIASLCEVLGVSRQFENFVPGFCEIRELPI